MYKRQWLGNAKDLILSGQATIQTAICCRDDIMVYLIQMGLEEGLSFTIIDVYKRQDCLWPDFNQEELEKAILSYNRRDRRFGGVK